MDFFFALVRAGLWADSSVHDSWFLDEPSGKTERKVHDSEQVNWDEVYQLAEEQSVIGIVLAGLEYFSVKPPQELLLQLIGEVQILEQQNQTMNQFIADLIEKLRRENIYTLLLKGQGVAQCYERPLWRSCGDVDLLLSDSNYQKAKNVLAPLASSIESESIYGKHLGLTIDSWAVELHGTQHTELSYRIDRVIDSVQDDLFYQGNVRYWENGNTQVFLPSPNNDVIFVFTHFLKHFYKGGIGLRQICDWCRLIWTYKDSLNHGLLESRIRKMGLTSEWKAFGAFAVEYLGMPVDAMPLLDGRWKKDEGRWEIDKGLKRKADKICAFILEVGNMGHNRDMSYFEKYPYFIRKVCSMGRRCGDLIRHAKIFPLDSLRFFPYIMYNGLRSAVRGE